MTQPRHIESIPAAAAFARARHNTLRRYPAPDRDADRLYPLASPTASPSFEIAPQDTIFAIGSCFARNVEKALEAAGKTVLSRNFELGEIGDSLDDGANFYNKYSIHSVVNEIRWALERDTFPGERILYQTGPDKHWDAQLGMARLDFPKDTILDFRHRYLDGMAQVATADVVILTLGYVETWYDRELDLYLNVVPPMQVLRQHPDRFEFRVLSYSDIMAGLEELYALLRKHRTKPLKMLITVSPVPLLATFRDMDVLVANAYSKSVQRGAIDEFLLDKDGIDYFPSYEFVTLSNPEVAWSRNDYRHVSSDVVQRIMSNVLTRYIPAAGDEAADGEMTTGGLQSSIKLLSKMDKYQEIVDLIEQNRGTADSDVEVLMAEAAALRRLQKLGESYEALSKAVEVAPQRYDPLERMIMLCRPMRKVQEARDLLHRHERAFPKRDNFRERVDWV